MSETLTLGGLLGTWALMLGWMALCTWRERRGKGTQGTNGTKRGGA